jgi:putative colanic acid biosynthesis acetyltransferase WcaF
LKSQNSQDNQLQIHVSKKDCPSPHSLGNKIARVIWGVVWVSLFRPSPRIFFGWRRFLLGAFGASIGKNARISPSVTVWAPWNLSVGDESAISHHVDCYCVDRLVIGNHATVSQYAILCTASHDISTPNMKLISSPIVLDDQCWVCAGAFVGPGITIHDGAVVGAMSVVTKDIEAWTVHAGNPARMIKKRSVVTDTEESVDAEAAPGLRPSAAAGDRAA